jgi:hypothetical protein
MSTKNNPGNYDCYTKAAPDEPMFILLARDKHAPSLVWLWAAMRELDLEDPRKIIEARACAEDMLRWQLANGRKTLGIGHAVLIGVMELIRAANANAKDIANHATSTEDLRNLLSFAQFDLDAL